MITQLDLPASGRSSRTARAALYHGVGDLRLQEIQVPAPGPREVVVEVAFCGLCGSDLHEFFSAQTVTPTVAHPLTGQSLPIVMGHEFSGTIIEVGAEVHAVTVGDRVAARPTYSCGECAGCRAGLPNICSRLAFHGLSGPGGGLSTFTVLPDSMVFRLPEQVSLLQGALVEPMAVAQHGVSLGVSDTVRTAFVGGAGPIGIGALHALRIVGVDDVIVSDLSPARRAVAAALGARVIDPARTSLAESLAGRTLDLAIEAAGVGTVIEEGVAALGPRGRMVLVGLHERAMSFEPISLIYREVSLIGSSTYTDDDFHAVLADMAAGGYDPDGWVTTRPLDEVLDALNDLRAGRAIKVLIDLHA